jgi:hypothetical protein
MMSWLRKLVRYGSHDNVYKVLMLYKVVHIVTTILQSIKCIIGLCVVNVAPSRILHGLSCRCQQLRITASYRIDIGTRVPEYTVPH